MNKTTIIFDFDNTLVNSLKYWYFEMNKTTFIKYGKKPNKEFVKLRQGKSNQEIAEIFLQLTSLTISTNEVFDCWNNLMYNNYVNKIKLIAGAKEFLLKLKNKGKKLVLATATNIELIKKVLPHFNLDIFDEIHSENTLKVGKNNPEFFKLLLNHLNLNSEEVFLFEDSFEAIMNARKARIDCCALIHNFNKHHYKELKDNTMLVIKNYKDKRLQQLDL